MVIIKTLSSVYRKVRSEEEVGKTAQRSKNVNLEALYSKMILCLSKGKLNFSFLQLSSRLGIITVIIVISM